MSYPAETPSLMQLEATLGANWGAIRKALEDAHQRRVVLQNELAELEAPDTSVVVFGSVARGEVTRGSDLDWLLLVDGQSMPEHKDQERNVSRKLSELNLKQPGASGLFGTMAASHDLVHNIGGEDDLNSNTTRRVLLLLESFPANNREVYDRVRRQIVRRYVRDDRGLTHGSGDARIPRFLLNDITRYWRTVTVDFVYKQSAAGDGKWALRNAKLRMSRKLIFAAGLLHVFNCQLDADAEQARQHLREQQDASLLTAYLTQRFSTPALEVIGKACLGLKISEATVRRLLDSYNQFLTILDDSGKRGELEKEQDQAKLRQSEVWREIRQVSHAFHEGLVSLFLREEEQLIRLTMDYGIF